MYTKQEKARAAAMYLTYLGDDLTQTEIQFVIKRLKKLGVLELKFTNKTIKI